MFILRQLFPVIFLATCLSGAIGQVPGAAVRGETLTYREPLSGPLAFSPDGRWLACGCGDRDMILWDLQRRKVVHRLHPETILHYSVTFSPDSRVVATGGHDEDVRFWDVQTGKFLRTLKGVDGGNRVYHMGFTPDGHTLVAVTYHGHVEFWNLRTGKRVHVSNVGWRAWALSIAPDGRTVVVAGNDHPGDRNEFIDFFDIRTGRRRKSISLNDGQFITSLAYTPDGKLLASGSEGGTLRVWNAHTGQLKSTAEDAPVAWLPFQHDRNILIIAGDETISFWSVKSGQTIKEIKISKDLGSVALSPNGKMLAYTINGVVRLCDLNRFVLSQDSAMLMDSTK